MNPVAIVIIFSASISIYAGIFLELISDAASGNEAVYSDDRLLAKCLLGSTIGALISLFAFPPVNDTDTNKLRRICLKMAASMAVGAMLAPAVIEHLGWRQTGSTVIAASFLLSFAGISILHRAIPWIERWMDRFDKKPPSASS